MIALPRALRDIVDGRAIEAVTLGESGAGVFRVLDAGAPVAYLKVGHGDGATEVAAEGERLRWLAQRAPVPPVIATLAERGAYWLLTEALPGEPASELRNEAVVDAVARALRSLHDTPAHDCPFDHRLAARIALARRRTQAGLVDERDFDDARRGRRAADLLAQLQRERPADEDLVLTHGDACLPNVLVQAGMFTAFVDCGRAGVADRYQDLALAVRSIRRQWGEAQVGRFLAGYGLDEPDWARIDYYMLLDEFF